MLLSDQRRSTFWVCSRCVRILGFPAVQIWSPPPRVSWKSSVLTYTHFTSHGLSAEGNVSKNTGARLIKPIPFWFSQQFRHPSCKSVQSIPDSIRCYSPRLLLTLLLTSTLCLKNRGQLIWSSCLMVFKKKTIFVMISIFDGGLSPCTVSFAGIGKGGLNCSLKCCPALKPPLYSDPLTRGISWSPHLCLVSAD